MQAGFAVDRQFPVRRETDVVEITFENAGCVQCWTHEFQEVVAKVASCYGSEREPAAQIGLAWRNPALSARKNVVACRTTLRWSDLQPNSRQSEMLLRWRRCSSGLN